MLAAPLSGAAAAASLLSLDSTDSSRRALAHRVQHAPDVYSRRPNKEFKRLTMVSDFLPLDRGEGPTLKSVLYK